MLKVMSMIRILLVGIGFIVLTGMYCYIQFQEPQIVYVQDLNYIPSVIEIQQRLKDTGIARYDPGPIDGIPGPRMTRGWDNHTCDRFAKGE